MEGGIGRFLRRLRTAQKLSLRTAAGQAGIPPSTLSGWESGTHLPRLPELERLLRALGVSAAQRRQALARMDTPRAVRLLQDEKSRSALGELVGPPPLSGDLLRAMRRRRGWTLQQLAQKLGVQHSTISRWERSEMWPSTERLHALCYALGAHEQELLALTAGRFALDYPLGAWPNTPDELERYCDTFANSPALAGLSDLAYLALEARLWSQAARQKEARLLLACAYADHSHWLVWADREAEAGQYAERALDMSGEFPNFPGFLKAQHAMASCRVYSGHHQPLRGAEYLVNWLPEAATPDHLSFLHREIADYASQALNTEMALDFLARAQKVTKQIEVGRESYMLCEMLVRTDIFLRAGRADAVLPILESLLPRNDSAALKTYVREEMQNPPLERGKIVLPWVRSVLEAERLQRLPISIPPGDKPASYRLGAER